MGCDQCGASPPIRRPRAELVPPVRTTSKLNNPELFPFIESLEEPIDAQWTKLERMSPTRAALSRISKYFAWRSAIQPPSQSVPATSPSISPAETTPAPTWQKPTAYLVVNRAEVVKGNCACCGEVLASTAGGEKLMIANLPGEIVHFCADCGDNITSRSLAEVAIKHYTWDWVIPLRI